MEFQFATQYLRTLCVHKSTSKVEKGSIVDVDLQQRKKKLFSNAVIYLYLLDPEEDLSELS
ncbi:CLUMA_CG005102, isoform A [Clunio marinus]|uniref:CLUMA_CG005102, isoform A n=1 Tax=Clunio marinus TaxID=568069 RepID=A0A1J1HY19_9DIPT|nr:CLUMA_CG005102, isoform A [Clunio marinus]